MIQVKLFLELKIPETIFFYCLLDNQSNNSEMPTATATAQMGNNVSKMV
jgi:hypothetical protein